MLFLHQLEKPCKIQGQNSDEGKLKESCEYQPFGPLLSLLYLKCGGRYPEVVQKWDREHCQIRNNAPETSLSGQFCGSFFITLYSDEKQHSSHYISCPAHYWESRMTGKWSISHRCGHLSNHEFLCSAFIVFARNETLPTIQLHIKHRVECWIIILSSHLANVWHLKSKCWNSSLLDSHLIHNWISSRTG